MKYRLLLMLVFTITGCSGKKIYLFARYLQADETQLLETELTEQGFSVESNTHYFPYNIKSNTFVHPLAFKAEEVRRVFTVLDKQEYTSVSSQYYLLNGNHNFTGDGFGLYLFSNKEIFAEKTPGENTKRVHDLLGEYESNWHCVHHQFVTLNLNGTYQIESNAWSEELAGSNYEVKLATGKWNLLGDILVLIDSDSIETQFKISKERLKLGQYMKETTSLLKLDKSGKDKCSLNMSLMERTE